MSTTASVQKFRNCFNILRDDALEESANLPDPGVLALEITEDLEAALEQFAAIAEDLKR